MPEAPPPDEGASLHIGAIRYEHPGFVNVNEAVAVEVPLSISFNGQRLGVMLASPCDIEDFIVGFALSEGIIDAIDEISTIEILAGRKGHIVSVAIPPDNGRRLSARQRLLVGKSSCGLCGTESLEHAMRPIARVERSLLFMPSAVLSALKALPKHQARNHSLGALHAAAFADENGNVLMLREDIGRHNALDKLIGAMARAGIDPHAGFAVISSRCSFEMVQKTALAGIGLLVAISAPTSLAIELAQRKNVGLAGFARDGRFTLYAGADRIAGAPHS